MEDRPKISVWEVMTNRVSTGTRIESYTCSTTLFTDEKKAYDHAWNVANKFSSGKLHPKRKDYYFFEDDAYPCFGNSVRVRKVVLDFSKDVINETVFGQ